MARTDTRKLNIKISALAPLKNDGTYEEMWLGYDDRVAQGYWRDSDGNPPLIQNWGTDPNGRPLPDNSKRIFRGVEETQDCVIINYRMRSLWDDDFCTKLHYAACQRPR